MRRLFAPVLFAALATAGVGALLAPPAHAEIDAGCTAHIAGINVQPLDPDDSNDAIPVRHEDDVTVTFSGPNTLLNYQLLLEFAGFQWTVKDFDDPDPDWGDTVPVSDYAKHGVGLYKVVLKTTNADGTPGCEGAALVDVDGDPLSTTAGIIGAIVTVVGVVGVAASGVNASRPSVKIKKKVDKWLLEQVAEITAASEANLPADAVQSAEADRLKRLQRLEGLGIGKIGKIGKLRGILTWLAFPGLVFATGLAAPVAASPSPAGAGATGPLQLERVAWKPRVSFIGLLAGVFISVGTVVLLQQYSEVYPTRSISLLGIVLGLVVGLTVPSIFRLYDVWRANRIIAGAERRLNAALRASPLRATPSPEEEAPSPADAGTAGEGTDGSRPPGVADEEATPAAHDAAPPPGPPDPDTAVSDPPEAPSEEPPDAHPPDARGDA